MEITKYETRANADEGRALHCAHPIHGHKMYYGEGADENGERVPGTDPAPVTMTVRGFNCPTMKKLFEVHNRRRAKLGNNPKPMEVQRLNEQLGEELMDATVIGWDGFTKNGAPLPCDRKTKVDLFEQFPRLWADVQEFAQEPANFLGESSAD